MKLLPIWVIPDTLPAYKDAESKTAIEQTYRVYQAMQDLINEYNTFAEGINTKLTEFKAQYEKDIEVFTTSLRQEFQDFIDTIDIKISALEDTLTISIKEALEPQIQATITEMQTAINNSIAELETITTQNTAKIGVNEQSIEDLNSRITDHEERINNLEDETSGNENNIYIGLSSYERLTEADNEELNTKLAEVISENGINNVFNSIYVNFADYVQGYHLVNTIVNDGGAITLKGSFDINDNISEFKLFRDALSTSWELTFVSASAGDSHTHENKEVLDSITGFKTINGISIIGDGDIQQDLNNGEQTLGEVLEMFDEVVGKNKYNKNACNPSNGYMYNASGVLTAGTSWATSGKIPVLPNTTYTFSTNTTIVYVSAFSGENGETHIERVSYSNNYTTPAECTYIAFSIFGKGHTEDEYTSAIDNAQLEIGETASAFEEYKLETILKTEHIENGDIIKEVGNITEFSSNKNLYNKEIAVSGKYVSKGSVVSGSACYTGFIPVKPNTQYCLSADPGVVSSIGAGFTTAVYSFDENMVYIENGYIKSNAGSSICLPFFTGENTYYVAVNFFLSFTYTDENFTTFTDSIMLEYGSCRSYTYKPYQESMIIPSDNLSNASGLDVFNKYKGKKWISCGTSITWYDSHPYSAGLHTDELCRGYQYHVCKALGLLLTNDGISGATLGNKSTSSLINRYTSINWTDYDLATIEFGVNDFGSNIAFGGSDEQANTDTFAGCLKTIIEYILTANPNIKLIICTEPDVRGSTNNTNGDLLEDFTYVAIEIAKQYRLPICDWYFNSGINSFTKGDSSVDYLTADGTHPNDKGHKRMGELLIKTILY